MKPGQIFIGSDSFGVKYAWRSRREWDRIKFWMSLAARESMLFAKYDRAGQPEKAWAHLVGSRNCADKARKA
jgi:hypothetical protein